MLLMVTINIVINSTRVMGTRVTISCRYCIAFEVMLLFLVVHATICNFFLPEGCHGNLPVLNLLSAPVAKNQHFPPCRKKICVRSKNDDTFTIATTFSVSMQSLGEIELRAPAVLERKLAFFVCHAWSACAWRT